MLINSYNFIIFKSVDLDRKISKFLKPSVTSNFEIIKVYFYTHHLIIMISYCLNCALFNLE